MYSIALHGGAGTLSKTDFTPELELTYTRALREALLIGESILNAGGPALDAVEKTVKSLEDSPLFNAGKGAVFTHDQTHELDASIMDGKTGSAGAIAGVSHVANPISLARKVMDNSQHVLLCGGGAEAFAQTQGIDLVNTDYFYTDLRWNQLQQVIHEESAFLDHSVATSNSKKFGTVGAVALDRDGNIAAATSTGGMTNKRYGRIGDTPLIGAGTYANNQTCAVSCTGHGEYFIRSVVAYDVSCLMEYGGLTLEEACRKVVHEKLVKLGGEGGLIAVDKNGTICLPFNSAGMYRAWKTSNSELASAIF
jgi:beta-aspartyl-peptidase (threonine type)